MITRRIIGALALLKLASAYSIPSADGFPKPDAQQILKIQNDAGGVLPNEPPPPELTDSGITNFQLIAFNEQFEVAFFSSLIENITNNVDGYQSTPGIKDTAELLEILNNVKAVSPQLIKPSQRSDFLTHSTARRASCYKRSQCTGAFQGFPHTPAL